MKTQSYEALAKLDALCQLANTVLPTLLTYLQGHPDLHPVSENTIHWRFLSAKD